VKPQRSKFAALGVLTVLAIPGVTRVAHAAGIEDSVAGAVNLGRAANYVRVNDFMATWQNPANLALVPGGDLGGELRFPLMQACFDRAKDNAVTNYREPTATFMGAEHFGNVCSEGKLFPTGNLGWAQSLKKGWGYGVGFFTPAGSPTSKYGDDTNVTVSPAASTLYQPTLMGVESPTRYLLLERMAVMGFLMAGLGAQPIPQLRFGFSAGVGFASIHNSTMVSAAGGSFRDQQIKNDINAKDWAIPRMTISLVVAPHESFEILGQLTYQGDIKAQGYADQTANGVLGAPRNDCRSVGPDGRPNPGVHCRIDDVKLTVPMPTLEATVGLRYAKRRTARRRVLEPLKDEIFDLELNAYWSQTSNVDAFRLRLFDGTRGAPGTPHVSLASGPTGTPLPVQPRVDLPHHWTDTYGVRFGGDYNAIANLLAIRLGVSYETSAVPNQYMNIDAWPVQKVGLHAGLTLAHKRTRLTLAYSHVFFGQVEVPVGSGRVTEVASTLPEMAQAVNEGFYQASLDVISVQSNLSF
jgi:long-subunit fatty acid transport protein